MHKLIKHKYESAKHKLSRCLLSFNVRFILELEIWVRCFSIWNLPIDLFQLTLTCGVRYNFTIMDPDRKRAYFSSTQRK